MMRLCNLYLNTDSSGLTDGLCGNSTGYDLSIIRKQEKR
jgi:hypothetical protein